MILVEGLSGTGGMVSVAHKAKRRRQGRAQDRISIAINFFLCITVMSWLNFFFDYVDEAKSVHGETAIKEAVKEYQQLESPVQNDVDIDHTGENVERLRKGSSHEAKEIQASHIPDGNNNKPDEIRNRIQAEETSDIDTESIASTTEETGDSTVTSKTRTTTADIMAENPGIERKFQNETHIESYEEEFARLTVADPTQRTVAYTPLSFYSGYVNELMVFSSFVVQAYDRNFTQILLRGFRWKDVFATNKKIFHEKLFDVVHWNKNYAVPTPENNFRAALPRLVVHHPSMTDYDPQKDYWAGDYRNATRPYGFGGRQNMLFSWYKNYRKKNPNSRHPSDLAILKGALRPHPDLQSLINRAKESLLPSSGKTSSSSGYMCLHPRVEPDMQKHGVCRDKKVVSLEKIIDDLYVLFPSPPVDRVLIVLFRKLLEDEDASQNELAGRNLALLNRLRKEGMWNGTVPVYEAGTGFLPRDSYYGTKASSIAGSILNYNLALDADIFVGSPVSSYAMQVMATRYNRNNTRNFLYLPDGIKQLPQDEEPPRFVC